MSGRAPGSESVYLFAEGAKAFNRPREALKALRELDPDRGFTHGWWVYWQDVATALHMLGEHRDELNEARDAVRRFPGNLQILTVQVRALAALGRTGEIRGVLATTSNLEPQLDWTPADAMLVAATELRAHGWPAAADSLLVQTDAWLTERARTDSTSPSQRYLVA